MLSISLFPSLKITTESDDPFDLAVTPIELWMFSPGPPKQCLKVLTLLTACLVGNLLLSQFYHHLQTALFLPLGVVQTHIATKKSPHFTLALRTGYLQSCREIHCQAFLIESPVTLVKSNVCMCPEHFSHNNREFPSFWATSFQSRDPRLGAWVQAGLNQVLTLL